MKKLSAVGLAAVLALGGMSAARAADVLIVDLNTANRITITALPGLSSSTATGSNTTGFYLAGFFASAPTQAIGTTTYTGTPNLTISGTVSDGTPSLFRSTNTDPGLNVWSYTATATSTITAGTVPFTGSATWNVSAALYSALLTAPLSGTVYFPADDITDLATASIIGTYTVSAVPEPASALLLSLGAAGLLMMARRREKAVA